MKEKVLKELREMNFNDLPFPDVLDAMEQARKDLIIEHLPEQVKGTEALLEIIEEYGTGRKLSYSTLKTYVRHENFPGRLHKDGKTIVYDPRVVLQEWEWKNRPLHIFEPKKIF